MSYTPYCTDTDNPPAAARRTGQDSGAAGNNSRPYGAQKDSHATGPVTRASSLQTVAAGILGSASPLQFKESIDIASRELGNRAFLRWVGALSAAGRGRYPGGGSPRGPQVPKHLLTRSAPLQFMDGKRGKKGEPAAKEPPPAPEEKKKKKKSRVQTALSTLRAEGVEAFSGYIEAEIGEAALLQNLSGRIVRAQDLGDAGPKALRVVEKRMAALDPELGAAMAASGPGPGQVREKPETVPVKPGFNRREVDLFDACLKGDAGKVRRLLRHGKIDINMGTRYGTLLYYAAFKGRAGIVRELLSMEGIDVNLATEQGATPLYAAADQGNAEVVKLLLARRETNVNLETKSAATPLHAAVQNGHTEVVKQLLSVAGTRINLKSSANTTPLIAAAELGHDEIVRLLLARPDVCVDTSSDSRATALYLASQNNRPGIVAQLIARGAGANLPATNGLSPLAIAASLGHDTVAGLLLRAPGIQVDYQSSEGATALAYACQYGHKGIVKMLIRKKACPNTGTPAGLTPLHIACLWGNAAIAEMLLHAGADMDAVLTDPEGKIQTYTPCKLAELGGRQGVVSILAAYRRRREKQPAPPTPLPAPARESSTPPPAMPFIQPGATAPVPAMRRDSEATGAPPTADTATAVSAARTPGSAVSGDPSTRTDMASPLAQAQDGMRQEVLRKLEQDTLEPLEGIRLLVDVNAAGDLDSLCILYNKLAHVERRKERARRQGRRRGIMPAAINTAPGGAATAPVFALGERTGLDADAVEGEIRDHLAPRYRRFVSQAVNDMEFGRGKPTSGYPGLWHVSAGIAGVGSCSVFYYLDAEPERIRIAGIGYHAGRASYRLVYAAEQLGSCGHLISLS